MTYKCDSCGRTLYNTGDGLGTWTCPAHGQRFVTVNRDLSGGKENAKDWRKVPMTVKRHTKVRREVEAS